MLQPELKHVSEDAPDVAALFQEKLVSNNITLSDSELKTYTRKLEEEWKVGQSMGYTFSVALDSFIKRTPGYKKPEFEPLKLEPEVKNNPLPPPVEVVDLNNKHEASLSELLDNYTSEQISPDKSFRVQNMQVVLVYEEDITKKDFVKNFKIKNPQDYFFFHQLSGSNACVVYIRFKEALTTRKVEMFDLEINGKTYEVASVRTPNQGTTNEYYLKQLLYEISGDKYLGEWLEENKPKKVVKEERIKKDKRPPEKKQSDWEKLIDSILECKTNKEAVKKFGLRMSIPNLLRIRELKELPVKPKISPEKTLCFQWQKDLWKELLGPVWDHRRMKAIIGRRGLDGKSQFCKTFISNFGGILISSLSGGSSNLGDLIRGELDKGGSLKYILIDLPRSAESHKIWDSVETLLNGTGTTYKYHSSEISFENARILFFSNWDVPVDFEEEEKRVKELPGKLIALKEKIAKVKEELKAFDKKPKKLDKATLDKIEKLEHTRNYKERLIGQTSNKKEISFLEKDIHDINVQIEALKPVISEEEKRLNEKLKRYNEYLLDLLQLDDPETFKPKEVFQKAKWSPAKLSNDRWDVRDILDVINKEDGKPDKIFKVRFNPYHNPNWKPPRVITGWELPP